MAKERLQNIFDEPDLDGMSEQDQLVFEKIFDVIHEDLNLHAEKIHLEKNIKSSETPFPSIQSALDTLRRMISGLPLSTLATIVQLILFGAVFLGIRSISQKVAVLETQIEEISGEVSSMRTAATTDVIPPLSPATEADAIISEISNKLDEIEVLIENNKARILENSRRGMSIDENTLVLTQIKDQLPRMQNKLDSIYQVQLEDAPEEGFIDSERERSLLDSVLHELQDMNQRYAKLDDRWKWVSPARLTLNDSTATLSEASRLLEAAEISSLTGLNIRLLEYNNRPAPEDGGKMLSFITLEIMEENSSGKKKENNGAILVLQEGEIRSLRLGKDKTNYEIIADKIFPPTSGKPDSYAARISVKKYGKVKSNY